MLLGGLTRPLSKWLVLSIFMFSTNWTAIQSYLHGLNAAQLENRSVIYEHTQRSVFHGLHKSELYNFQLNTQSGFASSTHQNATALRNASISQIHDYDPFKFCSDAFDELVSVNVVGSTTRKQFDAQSFLSTVSHKRIAFVGDSLMRQFYLEFASEMLPLETNHRYGYAEGDAAISRVSRVHVASATMQTSYTENRYSTREYAKSNLTVMWCHDDNLQGLTITKTTTTNADNNPAHHHLPCLQEAVHNDVIILGVGLWYKPLHPPTTQTDYFQDMELKYNKLVMSLMRYRGLIHRANPKAHIIWQLIPHIGQLDEDLAVKKIDVTTLKSTHPEWFTGKYWSVLSRGALWPVYYNHAIHAAAARFSDQVLDMYRLSYLYIKHFEGRNIAVHSDFTHYCPGSIFRGALFLLQNALTDGKVRPHRNNAQNLTSH